jgi:putative PIN family toxin of toxin-antitoxin system
LNGRLLRLVFDTNVLISAVLFPRSPIGLLVAESLLQSIVLISAASIAELEEVLMRPKFDSYHTPESRHALITGFISNLELVNVTSTVTDCVDEADNKFLELALSGDADFIITGDAHLLALHPWRDIPILKPTQYLALNPLRDLP